MYSTWRHYTIAIHPIPWPIRLLNRTSSTGSQCYLTPSSAANIMLHTFPKSSTSTICKIHFHSRQSCIRCGHTAAPDFKANDSPCCHARCIQSKRQGYAKQEIAKRCLRALAVVLGGDEVGCLDLRAGPNAGRGAVRCSCNRTVIDELIVVPGGSTEGSTQCVRSEHH
jgi:hypothetical protein